MHFLRKEEGQTLIIILSVMVLALGIGITISTNFVKSVRNYSQLDSSNRALAAAEALVERILIISNETLGEYINTGICGDPCALEVTGIDGVRAVAAATLTYVGNTSDPFEMEITTTQVSEINLNGYPSGEPLYICWNDNDNLYPAVTGTLVYGARGNYLAKNYAYNSLSSPYVDNGFSYADSAYAHQNCFTVEGQSQPVLLRLKAHYNDVEITVIPAPNITIPSQGILIVTEGKVADSVRKVTVMKSETFLPADFDYSLFSKSYEYPLSN